MFSFIVLDVHEVLLFFDKDQSIVGYKSWACRCCSPWLSGLSGSLALWLSGSLCTLGSLGSLVLWGFWLSGSPALWLSGSQALWLSGSTEGGCEEDDEE